MSWPPGPAGGAFIGARWWRKPATKSREGYLGAFGKRLEEQAIAPERHAIARLTGAGPPDEHSACEPSKLMEPVMTLRVGIVGCGKIADGHVEEIAKMGARARVVAVCDLELLMAEQLAFRYGIPCHYDSLAQMLERERLDVLHITTPPGSHLALATMAIAAGCHVYVEKPLTMSYAESKRLIDTAVAANKLVTVGYTYYFDPPARTMRALIDKGVVGDVVHLESFYGYNLSGQFGSAILGDSQHWVHRLPGKLFHNNVDHLLNKATEFIADDEPVIHATGYTRREHRFGDGRDAMLDELRLTMIGSRVSMYGTFSAAIRPTGHFLRVYGTNGSLHVDFLARTVVLDARRRSRAPSAGCCRHSGRAWRTCARAAAT